MKKATPEVAVGAVRADSMLVISYSESGKILQQVIADILDESPKKL